MAVILCPPWQTVARFATRGVVGLDGLIRRTQPSHAYCKILVEPASAKRLSRPIPMSPLDQRLDRELRCVPHHGGTETVNAISPDKGRTQRTKHGVRRLRSCRSHGWSRLGSNKPRLCDRPRGQQRSRSCGRPTIALMRLAVGSLSPRRSRGRSPQGRPDDQQMIFGSGFDAGLGHRHMTNQNQVRN